MKILLTAINAKYIHSNPALYDLKAFALKGKNSPLASEGLCSNVPKEFRSGENCSPSLDGLDLEIAEYTINNLKEAVLSDIFKKRPDVIALSCYIWNINFIKSLLPDLHKVMPETAIWLGGPEVSFHAEHTIALFPYIKGIMIGEGEETFRELCLWYAGTGSAKSLWQIRGLCLSDNGTAHFTGIRPLLDLDEIPFPYDDLSVFENRIIYYESSRGCPFSCAYCLSAADKPANSGVRYRSMDPVKKELQFFLDHKVPQVKFIDRTFNANRTRTLEIWNYILKNDNGLTNFHFEIAADLLTDDEIDILSRMRPGLVQLEIGVQSSNETALEAVHRKTDIGLIREAVRKIKDFGNVHVHLDLIAGLPFEDFQSFQKSFNDVFSMKPDQLQLGFLKVLKGSPIESQISEYDIVCSAEAPYEVLSTRWISFDELLILKGVESMTETYYNSLQFTKTLPFLISRFNSAFDFFRTLSEFCEAHGYSVNTPSRMGRYFVLLECAAEYDPENLELYKELLTFDAYSRENCKSRPDFAPDLSRHQKLLPKEPRNSLLHKEVFTYPVWMDFDYGKPEKLPEPVVLEFDYTKKSPLSRNAAVRIL